MSMMPNFSSAETPLVGSSSSRIFGLRHHGERDVEQLAHPAGQHLRVAGRGTRRGRSARACARPPPRRAARSPGTSGWPREKKPPRPALRSTTPDADHHVLEHGERGVELRDLERAADAEARDVARRERGDVAPLEVDAAAVGLQVAGDHVDEGGLAGAVGADQADHGVPLDGGVDVARRRHRAEVLVQAPARRGSPPSQAALRRAEQRPQARRAGTRSPASSDAPSTICQVLGERSKATVWMMPKISAPRNGAITLPVPARMVMKMNSPEVRPVRHLRVDVADGGRGERAAEPGERRRDHVVDVDRVARRGAHVLDADLVVLDRRREAAQRRAEVAVHGERGDEAATQRRPPAPRSAPRRRPGGSRTGSRAAR